MQVAYYNSVESAWKYLMMVPESSFLSDQGLQPGFYLIFAATCAWQKFLDPAALGGDASDLCHWCGGTLKGG